MRTLAVSTQLKNALALNETIKANHAAALDKLEKEKVSESNLKEMYRKNAEAAQAEIDQMHLLLDGMSGALPREADGEESWNKKKYNIMTRLASWIASKVNAA